MTKTNRLNIEMNDEYRLQK